MTPSRWPIPVPCCWLYNLSAILSAVIALSDANESLRSLGEPIVRAAFEDLLSNRITSPLARRAMKLFAKRWKDYSRAALMALSCKAVGGDPSAVRPVAKALVLTGGAFDLHDDIIDHSYARGEKQRKSLLGIYGQEVTLLTGDALLIEGLSRFYELGNHFPQEKVEQIVSVVKAGLFELGSAEIEELSLVRNLQATPKKYLRIIRMKAADVESYTKIGAIIGGGTAKEVDALGRFGRLLGMIVILRDDIEDTFNDKFELRSRVTKESLPLPILHVLDAPGCRSKLEELFESPSDKGLDELISIVESNAGFEKSKTTIETYVSKAKASLRGVRDPRCLLSIFTG